MVSALSLTAAQWISTHALREEGDSRLLTAVRGCSRFLPTPSVRRATVRLQQAAGIQQISTHALREEGDRCPLPLPPCR